MFPLLNEILEKICVPTTKQLEVELDKKNELLIGSNSRE